MAVSGKTIIVILIIAAVGYYVFFIRMKGKVDVSQGGVDVKSQDVELSATELYLLGHKAFQASQYDKMFDLYKKAEAKDPKSEEAEQALYNKGLAYQNMYDWKASYRVFDEYLKKYPNGKNKDRAEKRKMESEGQGGAL